MKCEERVSGYPLRIAGGFPCPYPVKYIMAGYDGLRYVCGIHRRWLIGLNRTEVCTMAETYTGNFQHLLGQRIREGTVAPFPGPVGDLSPGVTALVVLAQVWADRVTAAARAAPYVRTHEFAVIEDDIQLAKGKRREYYGCTRCGMEELYAIVWPGKCHGSRDTIAREIRGRAWQTFYSLRNPVAGAGLVP